MHITHLVRQPLLLVLVVATALLVQSSVNAQTDQGRIAGVVSDAHGAVVPGASVLVKNERTREERSATTTDSGYYIISGLRPSLYTVSASAQSLTVRLTNVQLLVGQELNLGLTLQATGVEAKVDIVAAADTGIDIGSAAMGVNVNPREVEALPLNGRQLSQLYLQAPGSVNSGSGTFGDIRFSGRAVQQNVIRYDGIEGSAIIDASPGNLNGEVPSPFRLQSSLENIQEFRVDSKIFPAEFGTGSGGQVSVVTKSGSNAFHGSLFEYMRNDALDAANFFDNIIDRRRRSGSTSSVVRLVGQLSKTSSSSFSVTKATGFAQASTRLKQFQDRRVDSVLHLLERARSTAMRPALPCCLRFVLLTHK
jgi:hypothetical protein